MFSHIVQNLQRNKTVFYDMLSGAPAEQYTWKPQPGKWCLLEVVCHLYDEERDDFRARLKYVLEASDAPWPSINPPAWVQERKYMEQDYEKKLKMFLQERDKSVEWLQALKSPQWDNLYNHPKFGAMTAKMFLSNWLAHDYLHFRQITKIKYEYLKHISGETLQYAGEW